MNIREEENEREKSEQERGSESEKLFLHRCLRKQGHTASSFNTQNDVQKESSNRSVRKGKGDRRLVHLVSERDLQPLLTAKKCPEACPMEFPAPFCEEKKAP